MTDATARIAAGLAERYPIERPPNVSYACPAGGRGGGGGAGAQPGSYIAKLTVGGREYVKPVTVLEDR